MTDTRRKGIFLAAFAALCWGTSGISGQYLLTERELAPAWMTFFRLLCSGLILLVAAKFWKRENIWQIWKEPKDRMLLFYFAILGMLGTQYGFFVAIKHSNAPTATVLEYIMPILIIFWNCISSKRLPRWMEIGCAFFAILGVALIATHGDFTNLAISSEALFWGLLAAASRAFYSVEPAKIIQKYGAPLVVGWGMTTAAIALSPVAFLTPFTGTIDDSVLGAFAFVVIFGTVLSFGMYMESTKYITPTDASILAALDPLTSIVLAVLLFDITFGHIELVGMALIILAVGVVAQKH